MVKVELRLAFSAAIHQAIRDKTQSIYRGFLVPSETGEDHLKLTVKPFFDRQSDTTLLLVSLEEMESPVRPASPVAEEQFDASGESMQRIADLEYELRYTKEHLQSTVEELETSNEELQSTNEEPHSVNEELYTVNSEYQTKIGELTQLNNDIDNLLRSTDIGTIFLDTDLRIRKFTPAIVDEFHLLPRDVGRPIEHISHNIVYGQLLPDVNQVLATGRPIEQEVRNRDGVHLLMRIRPYRTETNTQAGVVLAFIDVTRLNRAEQALRDSQALYSSLVENLPMCVMRKDLDGRLTFANQAFCRLLGQPAEDVLGRTDHELYPQELADKYRNDDLKVIQTREPFDGVERHKQDGRRMYVHTMKTPLFDSKDRILGVLVAFWDVTERISAAEEVKRYAADLEQSNQDLEQFAHVASHDLQEPLRTIGSYCQLLEKQLKQWLDSDSKKYMGFVIDASARMHRLIQGLLKYSHVGTRAREFEDVDTQEILNQTLADLHSVIDASQATVTHDELPTLLAIRLQMGQLFQNLIGNAIMYRSEQPPQIHVGVEQQEGQWVFSIRDNGIGIPAEQTERVFVIFQRLHARDQYPGTGIGLSLCKRIVERDSGRVWIESESGSGTTIFFSLPEEQD